MLALMWIAILTLLYVFFNDVLMDFNNPNRTPESILDEHGVTQVILQRNRYGHYVTSGGINDQAVAFILDTGATYISVPGTVADRLELPRGAPGLARTANGTVTVYRTVLNSVSIGDIRLHDVKGHINPHMHGNEILLGMSFLKHLDFRQSGDKLILSARGG